MTARDGSTTAVAIGAVWILVGSAVAARPALALAIALVGLGVALTVGFRASIPVLVASTFVTCVRIPVSGGNFLAEHAVLVAVVVALGISVGLAPLVDAARDRTCVLFAAFVAWNGVASVRGSVDPHASLHIVGWLALEWLMLVVLIAYSRKAPELATLGLKCAGAAAGVAIALWVMAQTVGTHLGTSTETLTGAVSASGLAHEPNVLGATLALWAFVGISGVGRLDRRGRRIVVALCVAGLLLTLTRAAVVGLSVGLLVWAIARGAKARRTAARVAGAFAVAVVAVWLLAPNVARPVLDKGANLLNFGSETGQARVAQWRLAIADLHGSAWLVGLGTNSFGQRHLEPTLPETPTPAYLGNLPLQVLYDSGVLGVALLAGVVLSVLTRERIRDGRAIGAVAAYLLSAVATSPFWFGTTWVFVAIAVVDRRQREGLSGRAVADVLAR